jgi:hypothetical protein
MTKYVGFYVIKKKFKADDFSHNEYTAGIGVVNNETFTTLVLTGFEIRTRFKPPKTLEGLMDSCLPWQPIGRLIYPRDEGVTIIALAEEEYNRLNEIRISDPAPAVVIDSIKYRK